MALTYIIGGKIVLPEAVLEGKALAFSEETGKIEGVVDTVPAGAKTIDACGNYVAPGLVDIHTHAGGGHWFFEEPEAAAQFNLMQGTTTVLPTLYFNMTNDQLVEQADLIQKAMKTEACANIAGFYMEAPYMNPKFGADRENNPWKGPDRKSVV